MQTLKQRRKQRIIKEIALLENMDGKLWFWSLATYLVVIFAFVVGIIGLLNGNKPIFYTCLAVLLVFFIGYINAGSAKNSEVNRERIWSFIGLSSMYFLYILGVIIVFIFIAAIFGEGGFNGISSFPDPNHGEDKPLSGKTRQQIVALALEKRRALLAKL